MDRKTRKQIERVKNEKLSKAKPIQGKPALFGLNENQSIFSKIGSSMYHYIRSGNKLYRSKFNIATDKREPQWIYDIEKVGFNYSSAAGTEVFVPWTYIYEGSSLSGVGEYRSFIAPYDGTIEKVMFRSDTAFDGRISYRIYEATTRVPDPNSIVTTKLVDLTSANGLNIAADTVVTTYIGKVTLGKGRYYAMSFEPNNVDTNDTNLTVVFKWDINS
tara:strand:- start:969 stop:1619 length:651 start_codon:yes stop_codon:yes gene_type:complete